MGANVPDKPIQGLNKTTAVDPFVERRRPARPRAGIHLTDNPTQTRIGYSPPPALFHRDLALMAESLAEARRIADRDPFHRNGIRKYRVVPWQINEGSMDIRFTLSDGKFSIA